MPEKLVNIRYFIGTNVPTPDGKYFVIGSMVTVGTSSRFASAVTCGALVVDFETASANAWPLYSTSDETNIAPFILIKLNTIMILV